ncbi:MAG: Hpt domain-containing protein [Bacteroidales bacterium]|nr:Hpt domain-containing protein [Bacteroidales bacterium]
MPIIEKDRFQENFQYFDKEVVLDIINIFLEEYPLRMNTIKTNIDQKDFDQLRFNAHSLKGVVANFIAPDVQNVARTMEMKGTNKDFSDIDELYSELKEKADVMVKELSELKKNYT